MVRFDFEPKKSKNNSKSKLLLLFSLTFVITLFIIGTMFKNFSPPVDVNIGGEEIETADDDSDYFQEGDVDSRLKWIQFEDNMTDSPVVQEVEKDNKLDEQAQIEQLPPKTESKSYKATKEPEAIRPKIPDIPKQKNIYNTQTTPVHIALPAEPPLPSIGEVKNRSVQKNITSSKVYVGFYQTLDEAKLVRDKIDAAVPGFNPYVKSVNGQYIVQVGSFNDRTKAVNFKLELSDKGFPARLMVGE